VAAVRDLAPFADVRWKDVSGVPGLTPGLIAELTFNKRTKWSSTDAPVSRAVMEQGRNPGLGVRALHAAGITGAGVSVGIVDQNLCGDHPEFTGRLVRYKDVGCNTSEGSMHGPAVASLLVGRNIGTAPGARLYFAAAPSWTLDAKFQADALNWLLDVNASLRAQEKIRVISVSGAPSGPGSNFTRNNADWDAACDRAAKAGVLVLDCTAHRGIIGPCYYDPEAPDDLSRVEAGFPGAGMVARADRILAPSSRRTVAEEYAPGEYGYQYTGRGGLSWAIPYAAGVLALGWQVNPELTPERAVALLRQTACVNGGVRIIHPAAFIEAVKATVKAPGSKTADPRANPKQPNES
jgi:subtilisin family serine protease